MTQVLKRTYKETAVQAVGASAVFNICKQDANRIYLGIFVTQNGSPLLVSTNPNMVSNSSIMVQGTTLSTFYIEFNRDWHPLLVTLPWYGITSGIPSGTTCVCIEEFEYPSSAGDVQVDEAGNPIAAPVGAILATDADRPDEIHQELSQLSAARQALRDNCPCKLP